MTGTSFGSDNHAGVHPDVLAAVVEANSGTVPAYGDDSITAEAKRLLRGHFGDTAEAFVVFNGTGANVVGLQSMVRSFESVICADSAHINVDECGAPEKLLGAKLVDVPAPGGKLTVEAVDAGFARGVVREVGPRARRRGPWRRRRDRWEPLRRRRQDQG